MARPCLVCSHANRNAIDELIHSGVSDYEVGRQFNLERVSIGRHRRRHLIKPARDRLAILAKDTDARRQRQELAAAAASDAPSTQALVEATLGLRAQAAKLQRIEDRLERMASLAERQQSAHGVAQVAAQQLRSVEVGARVAGVGGYGAQRSPEPGAGQTFAINILFSSTGQRLSIKPAPGVHLEDDEPLDDAV